MKAILALAALLVASVMAVPVNIEVVEDRKKPCRRNKKPINHPCPRPCDLKPNECGLGRCECPDKCSSLWFNTCSSNFVSQFCQDFFYDCEVKCDTTIDPSITGYEVLGACIAFSSYDRPECNLPLASTIATNHCTALSTGIVIRDGKFSCIANAPNRLLTGACFKECPKGFYPTCLVVKTDFDSSL